MFGNNLTDFLKLVRKKKKNLLIHRICTYVFFVSPVLLQIRGCSFHIGPVLSGWKKLGSYKAEVTRKRETG